MLKEEVKDGVKVLRGDVYLIVVKELVYLDEVEGSAHFNAADGGEVRGGFRAGGGKKACTFGGK